MIVPVKLIRWDIKQVILDKCKNQVWIKGKSKSVDKTVLRHLD